MASSSSSFSITAADVTWGRRESTCIETVVGTGLDAKSFNVDAPASAGGASAPFYIWFDTGASTDPAPAGRTGISVSVVVGDTAAEVATKLITAVDANGNFRATAVSGQTEQVLLESEFIGSVTAVAVDVDTTFTFTQTKSGVGGSLGQTEGGVTVTWEINKLEIKSDQNGFSPVDIIQTGVAATVEMSLLQMTAARWKTVVGSVTGDAYTPGGGTELVGFGDSRNYASYFDLAGELELHPTKNGDADNSENLTAWLTVPVPGSFNFSGEESQKMTLEFNALIDSSKQSAINVFAYGDNTQDVRS